MPASSAAAIGGEPRSSSSAAAAASWVTAAELELDHDQAAAAIGGGELVTAAELELDHDRPRSSSTTTPVRSAAAAIGGELVTAAELELASVEVLTRASGCPRRGNSGSGAKNYGSDRRRRGVRGARWSSERGRTRPGNLVLMPETRDHEKAAAEAVVSSFSEVSLHAMRDRPDVDLLHRDGFHIGMELVRTVDERERSLHARFVETCTLIKCELEAQSIQGAFWIYYDVQEMFNDANKRAWKRSVPKKIANFFKARGPGNVEAAELVGSGITCIASIEVKEAVQTFVGCGWRTVTERGDTLAETVLARKNQKLASYRSEHGDRFRQYWLAIASLGPGTVEDGGFSLLLGRRFHTDYDRVLLVNHGSNGRLTGAQDVTPERPS